ncbi:MAG: retroviral-like aspartic protease family protein [Planctomycetes bacterium]|nr:retroviral-like aspartic protease family protein [Planctomycetota bacterium]
MGTFHTTCTVSDLQREKSVAVKQLLVDTGSDSTWIPSKVLEGLGVKREKKDLKFVMANGQEITRSVGFVFIEVEDTYTVDEVVFAENGDLALLGARSLEGLNLTVDAPNKKLVAAGPRYAATGRIQKEESPQTTRRTSPS